MLRALFVVACVGLPFRVLAQTPPPDEALRHSVEQLRHAAGCWDARTAFLNPDGSVARAVAGTYRFSWVVPDRVLAGQSDIPELGRTAGLLFYVDTADRHIEMVSVGGDGQLWIMTGPLGGEERLSQTYPTAGGGTGRLRFTRDQVTAAGFESRMAYTQDGGQTWKPGNHQTFRRAPCPAPARGL